MSENCNHDCGSCSSDCNERVTPESFLEKPHEMSNIKKVIGVVSGKGGVGKSLVTSMLAVEMKRRGFKTAVLDADITGPSIPKSFGIDKQRVFHNNVGIFPVTSAGGTDVVSINLFLEDETEPVVWRGPMIAGVVKQFWTDVVWGDVDYMFVDMPPGTGDVPLTVMQSLPLDGIVIVTSPQELVGMIVGKAINMASIMNVPVLGIVENMSYFECPSCGQRHSIFGESNVSEMAGYYGIKAVSKIPMDPGLASLCDSGRIEEADCGFIEEIINAIK